MLELTGMDSVLRGIGILYWILAITVVSLAFWKPKTWQRKALWGGLAILAFGFLPGKMMIAQAQRDAYAKEAWAYFKKKCDTEAGEKIYKTYTGVKSVLVVKPLPPATDQDHFDQFWYGDPYSASATSKRVDNAAGTLVYPDAPISLHQRGRGFEIVESYASHGNTSDRKLIKYYFEAATGDYRTEPITQAVSRFGLAWEDISTPADRKFWIAGSRLSIVDLKDNSLVAVRIGYFIEAGFGSRVGGRRPWLTSRGPNTTCPPIHSLDYADRWFILKVLKPAEGAEHGK